MVGGLAASGTLMAGCADESDRQQTPPAEHYSAAMEAIFQEREALKFGIDQLDRDAVAVPAPESLGSEGEGMPLSARFREGQSDQDGRP